jgi:hypothetical protein
LKEVPLLIPAVKSHQSSPLASASTMSTATPAPRRSARLAARAAAAAAATRAAAVAADARAWWETVRDTMVEPCDYEPSTTSHRKLTILVKFTDGEVMTWCGNIPWNRPNGRPWDFSKLYLKNPNSPGNDVKSARLILIEDVLI